MIDSKAGIIGLVVGDAMGVPLEFCMREKLMQNPVTEMIGYGSHDVPKGTWSDDSSMTIATIDAIIKTKDINYDNIAYNFLLWMKDSKYTPSDKVFDIGRTTLRAIARYESKENVAEQCGGDKELDNGNGSLMRILPLVYYCYSKNINEKEIYEIVKNVSSITHRHEISIMGCFIYVIFGIELLKGKNLEKAYKQIKKIKYKEYFSEDIISKYERILKKNIKKYELDNIKSTGFVVDTLEATFWVLLNTNSYNQAIIGAINLGDDTDTVGACVGGLAGIHYGYDNINKSWINNIVRLDYITDICNKFNEVLNS